MALNYSRQAIVGNIQAQYNLGLRVTELCAPKKAHLVVKGGCKTFLHNVHLSYTKNPHPYLNTIETVWL